MRLGQHGVPLPAAGAQHHLARTRKPLGELLVARELTHALHRRRARQLSGAREVCERSAADHEVHAQWVVWRVSHSHDAVRGSVPAMGRVADAYARVSPRLAHRPGMSAATRAHAWLVRRSGGRLRRFLGADVLVLRTTGRRSGEPREAPMFYVPYGDGFAVVASNAAPARPPAWWLNLQAYPDAEAYERGKWHEVSARRATDEEVAELWPRFVEAYRGYDRYKGIATREMPVVVLERKA